MSNRQKTTIDFARTTLWSRFVASRLHLQSGDAVEGRLSHLAGKPEKRPSGLWNDYLNGTRVAYNGSGPVPNSVWASLARPLIPGSWHWYATPFWYLAQDQEFTSQQVFECCLLLPLSFREALLYEVAGEDTRASLRLRPVEFHWIYEFTWPIGPSSLGATACAMRRAELAGLAAEMRWAAVGLIWQIDCLVRELGPWISEPLLRVRELILRRFEPMVYFGELQMPIRDAHLARFQTLREQYLKWASDPTASPEGLTWPAQAQLLPE